MAVDPRTPVIVGVAQALRRPEDPARATAPVDMMAETLRLAAEDSGAGAALLGRADSVRVPSVLSWRYTDPGTLVADRLGISPRQTVVTTAGGNSPQMLLNDSASAIQRGELDVVLMAGAEAMYTRFRARKVKAWLDWEPQADAEPSLLLGDERPGTNDAEMARSIVLPIQIYPIFENALRAAAGESIDDHQAKIAALWSRFSEVAATNPNAWSPEARTASDIATVTADNRWIGFPYTKAMNANLDTDQSAAVIVCSVEAARSAGVPEEKWVFPWSGADAFDHWFVSERADLHSSPAIRAAGRAALQLAGTGIADIRHLDLYSCFPSAVQIGAAELGLGLDEPDRPLTVTGGLSFAGGPGNDYVMHSMAAMVDVLRADPGSKGLVTALGWYATKHAIGVYSTEPPPSGAFRHAHPQADVDALPRRDSVADHEGDVTIESYTVMHERDGSPAIGLVACLLPDGRRTWANTTEPGLMKTMTLEEFCGRPARLHDSGHIEVE
ncbi:MAG: acetyl-CoA acetyltransferase [Acidimicrobiales bacterium]|nr:acetyl-CoA acetyltransferase [Acidimicrobiales bacterium]